MPWYRVIIDPAQELEFLKRRELFSRDGLRSQTPICPSDYNAALGASVSTPQFTQLSAFHYYALGVRQMEYYGYGKPDRIGIVLNKDSDIPRSVFWRESRRGDISDDIFKKPHSQAKFNSLLEEYRFRECLETDILAKVQKSFIDLRKQFEKDGLDKADAALPWTEGLFRYHTREIASIVVQKDRQKSYRDGYNVAKEIEKITGTTLKFCYYDSESTNFIKIPRVQIQELAHKPIDLAPPKASFVSKHPKSSASAAMSHTAAERSKATADATREYEKNKKMASGGGGGGGFGR